MTISASNSMALKSVKYVKYLGMFIDKHLSWNMHILQLSKKLSRANGILSKLRHHVPLDVCIQVYYAIFYSHLTYACHIWGTTSNANINKIEVLQKKCMRILSFSNYACHTNPLFISLKISKVRDIITFHQLQLPY